MHNLTKIKLFRTLLWITYLPSLVILFPLALMKKKKSSSLFFFFDRYAIGGAQEVCIDILKSVADTQKTVYFTRKSPNDGFKERFYNFRLTECHDIHFWCDNLFFRLFSVHFFAFYINRHKGAVVLGSNSTFFYDGLPFFRKARRIELLHNFTYGKNGMEFFGLANYGRLETRMVIDEITRNNIFEQYRAQNIDHIYNERIVVAEYGVDMPPNAGKMPAPPLMVLYAGRGTEQKRVWLVNEIAEHFIKSNAAAQFTFAGPVQHDLSELVKSSSNVLGEVGDQSMMEALYAGHHVIILTSAFEGFPVVVKKGMAHGCVPVVTALPGNKIHLREMENALLIEDADNPEKVVLHGIRQIQLLLDQPGLLKTLSDNAYQYAQKKFGKQQFLATYRKLLFTN